MLLEGFVAVIALATIMIVAPEVSKGAAPGRVYGDGIARFLTVIIGPGAFLFAATFGAMAFSTFVFDTLDVATRLGRLHPPGARRQARPHRGAGRARR